MSDRIGNPPQEFDAPRRATSQTFPVSVAIQNSIEATGALEGDLLERANADAEAELPVRLHQSDARLLRAIEEALAQIQRGTFGACEVCQQPISKARSEPVRAHLCRDCKEQQG
jgi:RNA polymerase-binding transcription factor DksA